MQTVEQALDMASDIQDGQRDQPDPWHQLKPRRRELAAQVIAMHNREHDGPARFCDVAQACRSADIIAR